MKRFNLMATASLLATTSLCGSAWAEQWLYDEQYATAGFGYEDKMPNTERYRGTKLILEGRYILDGEEQAVDQQRLCCEVPAKPYVYSGVIEGAARAGFDGTGLEYAHLSLTPWAIASSGASAR